MELSSDYCFFLAFSAVVVFIAAANHLRPKSKRFLPPAPPALPVLGHLHLLKEPTHQSLLRLAHRYGPVLLLRFGSRPVLVVSSPAAAEQCFTSLDGVFASRPRTLCGKYLAYDNTALVFSLGGPRWRSLRRFAALHALSPSRIPPLSPPLSSLLGALHDDSGDGVEFKRTDIRARITSMTVDVLMGMLAGKRCGEAEQGRRLRRVVEEGFALSGSACVDDFVPLVRWTGLGGAAKRMENVGKEMDELFQELVEERRVAGKWRDGGVGGVDENVIIIDTMLAMQQQEPEVYADVDIKGMIMSLLSAGMETSSGTMEWAMALLLNNPDALQKAKAEIKEHVGHDRLVTDSDLRNLSYLNNIIKETLRLFPPGPLIPPHESSEDCTVAGFHVPKGTMLLVNLYAMQRDPNLWTTNPSEFRPERFDEGEGGGYKNIPFGAGRRRCPGETMAGRMMGVTLGALIQCFEWRRVAEELVDLSEGSGLSMPMAKPLQAMYRPYPDMVEVLSRLLRHGP